MFAGKKRVSRKLAMEFHCNPIIEVVHVAHYESHPVERPHIIAHFAVRSKY